VIYPGNLQEKNKKIFSQFIIYCPSDSYIHYHKMANTTYNNSNSKYNKIINIRLSTEIGRTVI